MEAKSEFSEVEVTSNRNWDSSIENCVREVGEYARAYKLMHITSAQINSSKFEWIMIASIVAGPLSSVISAIGMSVQPDPPSLFNIISSIVAFFAGVFTAVVKFSDFDAKSASHKLSASKFTSLESNVRRQLSLPRQNRIEANEYTNWVNLMYDDLYLNSPLISEAVSSKFKKFARKHNLNIPDEGAITVNDRQAYTDDDSNTRVKNIHRDTMRIQQEMRQLLDHSDIVVHVNNDQVGTDQYAPREKKLLKGMENKKSVQYISEMNKFSDGMMRYQLNRLNK